MEEVIDILAVGEHNEEDIEEAILQNIINDRAGPRRHEAHGGFDLNTIDEDDVKVNFRFNCEDIIRLTGALRLPATITTRTRNVISGKSIV